MFAAHWALPKVAKMMKKNCIFLIRFRLVKSSPKTSFAHPGPAVCAARWGGFGRGKTEATCDPARRATPSGGGGSRRAIRRAELRGVVGWTGCWDVRLLGCWVQTVNSNGTSRSSTQTVHPKCRVNICQGSRTVVDPIGPEHHAKMVPK